MVIVPEQRRPSACRMPRWPSIADTDIDVHQSAKIIRRTGDRRGADGVGKAC
jgi:hypothetical protein